MGFKTIYRGALEALAFASLLCVPLYGQITEVTTPGFKNGVLTVGAHADSLYQLPRVIGTAGKVPVLQADGTMDWGNSGGSDNTKWRFVGDTVYTDSTVKVDNQLIAKVLSISAVDITSDYDSTEDWLFGQLHADTDSGDITATMPYVITDYPDGGTRILMNAGSNLLILKPNGHAINGNTADRVIGPDGYVEIANVDGTPWIIRGSDYYVYTTADKIANLELWLDASDTSYVTKDGSNLVSAWDDKSGNGNDFSAAGAAQPLWVDSVQNDKEVIRFNGSDDVMSAGDIELHDNTAGRGMTVVAVVSPDVTDKAPIISKYNNTGDNREYSLGNRANLVFEDGTWGSRTRAVIGMDTQIFQIYEMVWEPGGYWKLYINGALSKISDDKVTSISDLTANLKVGGADYANAGFWDGDIAEIIVYSDAVSITDRAALRNNLAIKWDIESITVTEGGERYWTRDDVNSTLSTDVANDNVQVDGSLIIHDIVIEGIAGDTTRPGMAYYISGANTWDLADTSVSTRAQGLAIDSVNLGETCKFLILGKYQNTNWSWTAGDAIFSDSATAGALSTGGQAAPKKMQYYGTALDTITVLFNFDATIAY